MTDSSVIMMMSFMQSFIMWPVYTSRPGDMAGQGVPPGFTNRLYEHLASNAYGNDSQSRLVYSLLAHHSPKVRPIRDHRLPVIVNISTRPYQLLDVDEVNQCITINLWMAEKWYDEFLYWDPLMHDNITNLRIPHHDIWRPDTYLYNNLEMQQEAVVRLMNAILVPNEERKASMISLQYPAIYKTTCQMDVSNFPFDQQLCTLTFGSWTYDSLGIDYDPQPENVSLAYFSPNQEWDILSFTANREAKHYDALQCCPNDYVMVHFNLTIQRKSLFYTVNLIIPSVVVSLINFIGFFTLSSSDGGRSEKVTLGITTLLALGVILLQLADHTPQSSLSVPIVGTFILSLIVLVGLGTVITVIIIHFQYKGECGDPPAPWLKWILYLIGFLAGHGPCNEKSKPGSKYGTVSVTTVQTSKANGGNHGSMQDPCDGHMACDLISTGPGPILTPIPNAHEMLNEIRKIRKSVERMAVNDPTPLGDPQKSEWCMAATAIERFCLISFVSSSIILTVWFFGTGLSMQVTAAKLGA